MASSSSPIDHTHSIVRAGASNDTPPDVITLGMFIIDEFSYLTAEGNPDPSRQAPEPQIGGGGTYAIIGARIWLQPKSLAMIVDKGPDFPQDIYEALQSYAQGTSTSSPDDGPGHSVAKSTGPFYFRPQKAGTTRALNSYKGEQRGFQYLTPRIRITPRDHVDVGSVRPPAVPKILHFICSPARALAIVKEAREVGWLGGPGGSDVRLVYEPIPDRCVPEELPALKQILPDIDVLSPNAEEALSLLSIPLPSSSPHTQLYNPELKSLIEQAAAAFASLGMRPDSAVVVRSGEMGVYVLPLTESISISESPRAGTESTVAGGISTRGRWIPSYHTASSSDRVVDVTGAGNAFLGGFAAGLCLADGDGKFYEAARYGNVSASFVIEQVGLPMLEVNFLERGGGEGLGGGEERWNGEVALDRLGEMRAR